MTLKQETAQRMKKFAEMIETVYNEAEALRDCTGDEQEKKVFNDTRRALFSIRDDARHLAYAWVEEAGINY